MNIARIFCTKRNKLVQSYVKFVIEKMGIVKMIEEATGIIILFHRFYRGSKCFLIINCNIQNVNHI